jgi:hypothetical protein
MLRLRVDLDQKRTTDWSANMVIATDIQTSAQAAEALRPIAGIFIFALFAAGIIGIDFLTVPFFRRRGQNSQKQYT